MMKWGLLTALIVLSVISLCIGAAGIGGGAGDVGTWQLLAVSRWPRLAAIIITGAGMAIAGLIMQQLSQNKFASPSTTGTIESASLGILTALLFFGDAGVMEKIIIAFAFALAGSFLFIRILSRVVFRDALFVPLLGIMLGRVIAAFTTFLAYRYDLMQSLGAWLYGDFSSVLRGRYELLYLVIPVTIAAYIYGHSFTIAGLGEDMARGLGLRYKRIRTLGLVLVALLTSSVVLTVGEIPFIGLVVPNLITMVRGDNVRENLPYVAALGAVFVLACDILGRILLYPFEISVSVITGGLGSALFLFFFLRRRYA